MDKITLKQNWGQYCDTDKLVDDMMALLTKYHHKNTENGVCEMLEVYFNNKEPLIKLLAQSDGYVGDMRIIRKREFARDTSSKDVRSFVDNFYRKVGAESIIPKYKDEHGKTITDYMSVGFSKLTAKDLVKKKKALDIHSENISKFDLSTGMTRASSIANECFKGHLHDIKYVTTPALPTDIGKKDDKANLYIASGTKTSRAFNKICAHHGVDKAKSYNKLFAQYADLVSDSVRHLYFITSVNPLDYLTMSFGRSWASCHTIDKRNERHMPNDYSGMNCGGCVSYMLDNVSIITYVLDNIDAPIYETGKIYRTMFHYDVKKYLMLQGRVYPQEKDGATDLYQTMRTFVQEEFVNLLHLENNMWVTHKRIDESTFTCGVHYPDYIYNSNCVMFYPREKADIAHNATMDIGVDQICPCCGRTFKDKSNISCHYC